MGNRVVRVDIPIDKADLLYDRLGDLEKNAEDLWRKLEDVMGADDEGTFTILAKENLNEDAHALLIGIGSIRNQIYIASHEGGHDEA